MRGVNGWSGGHWDRQIAATEFARRYWLTLLNCHADAWANGEVGQRTAALRLLQLIGPSAYWRGWRPALLAEAP